MDNASQGPRCVFCDIVAGRAPASFVYQDENAVAFMDIRPVNQGHVLIVPRAHAATLVELCPDLAAHLMRVGQQMDAALRASGLPCEGVNLHLADGEAAGQDVFHVHLHVIPRFHGDGMHIRANRLSPDTASLDQAAARIRAALLS
jgi:diadenosine tetraphosphate (Ap4A) HIT family hydrolase